MFKLRQLDLGRVTGYGMHVLVVADAKDTHGGVGAVRGVGRALYSKLCTGSLPERPTDVRAISSRVRSDNTTNFAIF